MKTFFKPLTIGLVAGAVIASSSSYAFANSSTIKLFVNGKQVISDSPPLLINDRTMVPIRAITEALGSKVQWDQTNQAVIITDGNKKVTFYINKSKMLVNDHEMEISPYPILIKDRTYIPIRVLSENLSYAVHWDGNSHSVRIEKMNENNISVSTQKVEYNSHYVEVNGQYPVISGLSQNVLDKINQTLFSHVSYLEKINDDSLSQDEKNWINQNYPYMKYNYNSNYEIRYNQNGYLCITFIDNAYTGGAHGNYAQTSYLFDLKTGDQLSLSDLFDSSQDYVSLINTELAKQSQSPQYSKYYLNEIPSIQSDDTQFYLNTDGKLVIYFQPYEIASYAAGIVEFEMPFSLKAIQ